MKAIEAISHLMKTLKLTPNKDLQNGSTQHISAYGCFQIGNLLCLIRVADHNTFLYNWIDKNQHIDLTTSANYAITFVDEIPFHSKPNKENAVNAINSPDVILRQYVYNITALTDDEVVLVMDECIKLAQTGVFTDPLEEDDVKHAIIYRHRTNQPTVDMTSKTRKSHRKKKAAIQKVSDTSQSTDNNKTDKNESIQMNHKNTIRITESELKSVIAESVKRILQEEYDVSEGKLGRALGTLALGGALAFGGNNIKAQDMNQPQSVQMHQQNVEGFTFYAPQFKADYEKLLSYTNSKGYQNHDRECAKDMLADFPLDRNGSIHLEYIITCDSGYDMEKIMETSYDWFNYAFSSAEASVSKYDTQNGIITARGSYANIGQFNLNAVYYAKVVRVGADTDVILRFKDNKIKIDVMIRIYRMISGESTMRSNNSLVNVADVYPANPNSDNKVAYARAFINSYSYSMDKVKKYIEFLNDNMNNEITNDDAAWEISDRSSKGAKDMWDFNTPETMKQKYFDIQKQIQANKKAMRSMEKNSEQQLAMKQKNDELRAEMQRLNQEYLKMTGQQIMQFEHPY